MLGEDYEEEYETNKKDLFNNQNDYLEYSTNRSREGKKDRQRKHKKKSPCENCKALNQKISELEQLNEELLKIKEKLSKTNEDLSLKNEELLENNKNIINKNKELLSLNKQLKEENNILINKNNELFEEKTGYKTEISGLKKQLISKINEFNGISKETIQNSNISNGNKNINEVKDNKNNILNVDLLSLNSDSIPPKKEEIINNKNEANIFLDEIKYCTKEEYNELKNVVEELKEKINELEKWKKNFGQGEKKKKKKKNNYYENEKQENSVNQEKISKKLNDSDDKLSKSLTIQQKFKNNFGTETNNSNNNTNINNFNFNFENNNKKVDITPKMNKSFNKNAKDKDNKEIEKAKVKNQRFNSKIITNVEDLDLIARGLVKDDLDSLKNLRVGYKLIYRASEHGEESEDFHERCDDIEGTLTIIKTKEGNIFGGYTSLSWDPEEEAEKKDEEAFVFSLNLDKLYFESGKKDYSIFCDKSKGPCFVGMFAVQEYIFNTKSYINPWGIQCFSGEKTSYEINEGKNDFFIEELEVFQVIVKRS